MPRPGLNFRFPPGYIRVVSWYGGWSKAEVVLDALRMLLRHLDGRDRMRPNSYGSEAVDLARRIVHLDLQKPNRRGEQWWRIRRGWEDRLRAAGIDPQPPWVSLIQRNSGWPLSALRRIDSKSKGTDRSEAAPMEDPPRTNPLYLRQQRNHCTGCETILREFITHPLRA